jgi:transglutaminase-like putative cysteine protease
MIVVSKPQKSGRALRAAPYYARGKYSFRVWLPFGPGTYEVSVWGDRYQSFTVNNTREEKLAAGGEGGEDGRWLYPSGVVEADSLYVTNLLHHLCDGMDDPLDKTRAIHDYLVGNIVYDWDTYSGRRDNPQESVAVLRRGTAVCEGYSRAGAALMRAAGIPVKMVHATSRIEHGWNHVWISKERGNPAAAGWKFLDITWDDPTPDGGKYSIGYDYYLLDNLSDRRHGGTGATIVGDVEWGN